MSSNQTLLVIGSILVLTLLIVSFYDSSTTQMLSTVNNESSIASTGIAQAVLDNIQSRAFDEFTVSNYTEVTDSLTASGSLGPDVGEINATSFDDIDDFNGYSTIDSSTQLGNYSVAVNVYYIANMNPDSVSVARTFAKRVDVKVINMYMNDTLNLSQIISY